MVEPSTMGHTRGLIHPVIKAIMKINRFIATLFAALCFTLAQLNAFAQEWNPEQRDVWKNVEAYWAAETSGNLEEFINYMHPDYSGWYSDSPAPAGRDVARKFLTFEHKHRKTHVYHVHPLAIKVHGNVAIVHYVFTTISQWGDGKPSDRSGRWTDILMKQGDRWVLIGDHGGTDPKKPN
jgi:ketosteroid isomerase-like protein